MKKILWLFLLVLFWGCDKNDSSLPRENTPIRPGFPTSVRPDSNSLPSSGSHLTTFGASSLRLEGKEFFIRGFSIVDPWHYIKRKHRDRIPLGLNFLKAHIDRGLELGGNTVRIPLLPRDKYKEGFLDWSERYLREILIPLVNHITSQNKFVILDNHHVKNWNEVERADLYLWADLMITHFSNNPRVIFEVFNEPIKPNDWKSWASYIGPMIDQLQKVDNLLLVGGPYWSSRMSGASTLPIKGKNLAYTGHIYSNQFERGDAYKKNYPTKRPMVFTEVGFHPDHKEKGNLETFTYFYNDFLKDKSFIMWCYDHDWGPWMIKENGELTDSGKFYKEIMS